MSERRLMEFLRSSISPGDRKEMIFFGEVEALIFVQVNLFC